MKTPLSVALLALEGLPQTDLRPAEGAPEEIAREFSRRMAELLRSYDRIGRTAKNKFLLLLPGCNESDALVLAERIRSVVFTKPFLLKGAPVPLQACVGITASCGRSPIVVLQQAESALQAARRVGPGAVHVYAGCTAPILR